MNQINLLQSALGASNLRQQTISNNLANVDTPGYKAKQVSFEDVLKRKLYTQSSDSFFAKTTDPRHIDFGEKQGIPTARVLLNRNTVMQNNLNNVDVDKETTDMGKNALWYNALTSEINSQFQQYSIAITGRR